MTNVSELSVVPIECLDLRFKPRPWPFAAERRADIDAHFAALRRDRPAMWNGRVLLMHEFAFSGATFRGAYLETDFASFIAWRDWGWPDPAVRNGFGLAALQASDGAFVVGVMGHHTANAGKIYFPGGTPEPADVVDGRVDLDASVMRELAEETGLARVDVTAEPGWCAVPDGSRIALLKVLRAPLSALDLRDRVRAYLARQAEPELADVRIVRGPADIDPMMPAFMAAFFAHRWR